MTNPTISRRDLLAGTSAALAGGLLPTRNAWSLQQAVRRPRVAAIFTVLRFRSHAYNILENFLGPYYFRGELVDPGVDVVSMYADQFPDGDMAREVAARFGIPLCKSIGEALCAGGDELAVDAVLAIGEHGDYPYNARGQGSGSSTRRWPSWTGPGGMCRTSMTSTSPTAGTGRGRCTTPAARMGCR